MKEFCRFDMEHQLLDCWKVTDDLSDVFEGVVEQNMKRDDVANVLLGMQQLYNLKFEKLWNLFEEGVRNGDIR